MSSLKKSLVSSILITLLLAHQSAFADGGPITGNRFNQSLIGGQGSAGPTGPTGPAGPGSASTYGQLRFSTSQSINLDMANQWVAIPFNAFSPSSNMNGSTSSPATITVLEAGVYQINISLYFSSEDSPEGTFNQTTYTVGTSINGGPLVSCGAVYAGEAGYLSLNYSTLMEFSANDYIQFYMKSSAVGGGGPIFDNIVTLVNGNADLVQIAN